MKVLDYIQAFAAGFITGEEFNDRFYEDLPGFEERLNDDPHLPSGTYVGHSVFDYLLSLDLHNEMDIYNARETLREFLARHGQTVETSADSQDYQEALAIQPRWLDVLDTPYFQREVWTKRENRSGKGLHDWLADQFQRRFRYADIPPEWLQNPQWPMGEKGPLIFLGQMPVKGYWDNRAVAYLFYEEATKQCKTVLQIT